MDYPRCVRPPSVGHLGEFVFTKREGFFEVNALFTRYPNVRPVEAVFANLELFDQAGQRLMTVPANMTIRSGESHEQWRTKLSGIQEFVAKSPLPYVWGTERLLVGYSPRSIGTCPASAILSYFEVFYADGTTFKMHSPAWYFDAIPYRVPNNDVATFRDSLFQGWVEATVDSDGRVHVPSSGELSSKDVCSYLQEMVKSWVFLPAVYSGTTTRNGYFDVCLPWLMHRHNSLTSPHTEELLDKRKYLPKEGLAGRRSLYRRLYPIGGVRISEEPC